MLIPDEYGGIAIDAVSYSLVFEEISKAWMGVAGILGSHSLATLMLSRYGTPEQRARWLPDLATGKRRSGIALTEPHAGSDLQGIATVARREGDHYVVNGSKTWITNARHADPLPVLVKTDPNAQPRHRGMTILMIEQGTPGFTVGKDLEKLGYKGPESSEVFLSDCHVPIENLLGGEEGHGLQQALSALEFGRVNIAGRAVGVAQASLDRALAYARERHAFERPIAEFQAKARIEPWLRALMSTRKLHSTLPISAEITIVMTRVLPSADFFMIGFICFNDFVRQFSRTECFRC